MYDLEFLPIAQKELVEIVRYISGQLDNPAAAERFITAFSKAMDRLQDFPYACPIHIPIRPLSREYRKVPVQNYLAFYWVDEDKRLITIARVIYARRDCGAFLQ